MQLCFITGGIDFALHKIAEFYRKRFGIESSYKLDKSIRPRTSSRNPAIRLFLFGAAVFIQNSWVAVKLAFCRRICRASKRMITLRDFADILLYWVRRYYGENTGIG
jgi:IS4 transposase